MQTIYGPGNASNITLTAQKRLIRPVYAQTQGTPYAAYLDPSLRNANGTIRIPLSSDTEPIARSANAFSYEGSLTPGLVLLKSTGENVVIATGANAALQPFGLLAQWLGGTFDNVGQVNEVAAWRGPDSVFDLLAPAWNDTGLASAIAAAGPGTNVLLYAGTDGRLEVNGSPGSRIAVASVVERPSASRLRINLLV
jgi:hypothetical protein